MDSTYSTELADHLFRHEYGKMVAVLSRIFGFDHTELVEDVIQDAFVTALQTWKYGETPTNPSAWLMQVAKRKAIDKLRRSQLHQASVKQVMFMPTDLQVDRFFHQEELADNQLRLIFACCHPILKEEDQIALTLKMISGFGIKEIAHALITTDDAIKARLSRARKFIRKENIQLEIPVGKSLDHRIMTVLTVLYLIFNEGYYSTRQEEVIHQEICEEALRLTIQLSQHKRGEKPVVHALLALMFYHTARLQSRTDEQGNAILLPDQDRSLWDQGLIKKGHEHLTIASQSGDVTFYHIEAAIAGQHCVALSFADTDWDTLLLLYDRLFKIKNSKHILLNKAVVLIQLRQFETAQRLLLEIADDLQNTVMFHSVFATLAEDSGQHEEAKVHLEKAIEIADSKRQKAFLRAKLEQAN